MRDRPWGRERLRRLVAVVRSEGVLLGISLAANLGLAAYDSFITYVAHDRWHGALAVYYLILAIARLWLVHAQIASGDDLERERRAARRVGRALLGLGPMVGGLVFLATWQGGHAYYNPVLIYGVALFCFVHLGVAVAGFWRARRHPRPTFRAARALSLASALVSLYQLQTAMLVSFGDARYADDSPFNPMFGGAVFCMVMGLGASLIIRYSRRSR